MRFQSSSSTAPPRIFIYRRKNRQNTRTKTDATICTETDGHKYHHHLRQCRCCCSADINSKGTNLVNHTANRLSLKGSSVPSPTNLLALSKRHTLSDPIYTTISLPSVLKQVIAHPLFQRLFDIHQLGLAHIVFCTATHSRAEHCLGVAHLATLAVDTIRFYQPELMLTERQVVWAAIAGLCHDVGHGPFSHVWESILRFLCAQENDATAVTDSAPSQTVSEPATTTVDNNNTTNHRQPYHYYYHHHSPLRHEERSLLLCQRILRSLAGLFNEEDVEWVCWIIEPNIAPRPTSYRPEWHFLSEIVCNKIHGLDVDKLDYLARDTHYLCPTLTQLPVHSAPAVSSASSSTIPHWNSNLAQQVVRRGRVIWTLSPTSANNLDSIVGTKPTTSSCTHWAYDVVDLVYLINLPALRQHMHFVYYQNPQLLLLDVALKRYIKILTDMNVISKHELSSVDFMISLTDINFAHRLIDVAIQKQVDADVLEQMNTAWSCIVHNMTRVDYVGGYVIQSNDITTNTHRTNDECSVIHSQQQHDRGLEKATLAATLASVYPCLDVLTFDSKMTGGGTNSTQYVSKHLIAHL